MRLLSTGRKGLKTPEKQWTKTKPNSRSLCFTEMPKTLCRSMQPCFHFKHLLFLVFIRALYSMLPFISIGTVKLQNWHLTDCVTRQVVQRYISLPAEKLANEVLCSRLEMHMVNWSVLHLFTSAAWKLHAKHNPHNELGLSSQKVNKVCFSKSQMKKSKPIIKPPGAPNAEWSREGADLADLYRQQQPTASAKAPWAFWQS